MVKLRPAVRRFAEAMEKKLRENDYKGGWRDCTDSYLYKRMTGECGELLWYLTEPQHKGRVNEDIIERIVGESADVANFAMMLADNALLDFRKSQRKRSPR